MSRYPDLIERLLLHEDTLNDPLPKQPSDYAIVMRIRAADDAALLGDHAPLSGAPLALLRTGLFYFHNALEDSHKEVVKTDNKLASYWHGMIHRREGDFDNARYWVRRTGDHPVFQELHHRASDLSPHMARQANWDPFLFIHLCEQYRYGATEYKTEIGHLQRAEFAVFFDYAWRQCVAEGK